MSRSLQNENQVFTFNERVLNSLATRLSPNAICTYKISKPYDVDGAQPTATKPYLLTAVTGHGKGKMELRTGRKPSAYKTSKILLSKTHS